MTTDQEAPAGHRAAPPVRPARRPDRRTVVVAAAAAVALTAGALTGVQVRAARAQDARDTVAAQEATERAAEAAEAETAAAHAAARSAAAERLAVAWQSASTRADAALAAAQPVLDASAGQVADDAVRLALALAMDVVEAQRVGDGLAADLDLAVTALAGATEAVAQAQVAWLAEQEAAAAAAAAAAQQAAASSGRRSGGGAGADCGGAGSYEAPRNDGGTVFHTSTPTATGDGSNGNLPASAMTPLSWCQDSAGNQQWLRSDAAAALTSLNEAFRAQFGENVAVDMSYRSYADQVAMRAYYGGIAAQPGTSNHGLGTAIDTWEWEQYAFGSSRYEWLVANGPAYGWVAPSWARAGGSNPEYWHFEYTG